ncbi:alpha-2-macroglobulin family protein [Myxococcus qinghaiensis]|uniref:alpha-2-macroglobulin family protein n=1 Tax=Myxococcus qinghaiensis TaxID=2906758 RepID=UPI0020A798F5|nr:alpha-2-macroglobulin family protein [Myxococcus qinghaiensis]MCP3161646.1 MG2 domain-containing protein [Myxococcus qinghaiensis]
MHHTLRTWTSAVALSLLSLLLLATPVARAAQAKALSTWKDIDALVSNQKVEVAAQAAEARLNQARNGADESEWTRALIRTVQLRSALHGYETSVRFLREQPWPKGALSRATLNLYYANALVTYAQVYSWEVRKRELVASSGPVDLKAWTYEQIITEAQRAYEEVWKQRQSLGTEPVKVLSEYIQPNTYPEGVRSTLRDAVSYLRVGLLADSSHWRPEQANEVFRLDLGSLLEGSPTVDLTDANIHPLVKVAAVLGDLETWHRTGGRREAALEARLRRYEVLHQHFSEVEDHTRIRQHLAAHLNAFRDVPWWSMGQGLLAEQENAAGHAVRAHGLAKAGMQAHPKSLGATRCRTLVETLEAPDFRVTSMQSDGADRRSIEVTHRNVPVVHFRAFLLDVEARLKKVDDYNVLPYGDELMRYLRGRKPTVTWSTQLPATPDFQLHRTFVTPPLKETGTYVILSSAHEDFREKGNRVQSIFLAVTPWVALTRNVEGTSLEARVLKGDSGKAASEVLVRLIQMDYRNGFREAARARTNPQGDVSFPAPPGQGYRSFLLVVGEGRGALLLPNGLAFYNRSPPSESTSSLVFTDRSVYRPLQKVQWKVVAYSGRGDQARYQTLPQQSLVVRLMDPNHQEVERRTVRTNDFGSVAGEFTVPTGRLLGVWTVQVESGGSSSIRVEEYKRPTFEVTLKDADAPLRMNRPATFKGEARYYFGLPVASGTVRWRAYREPVLPWWWWYDSSFISQQRQLVAAGSSSVEEDGGFKVTFTPEADERSARTPGLTWRYRVEADATDEGGETRSASRSFRLGFVAVEGRVDSDTGFLREGSQAEVRLIRATLDGVPQPGAGRWRLVALKQPSQPLMPADEPEPKLPFMEVDPDAVKTPTPGDALQPRWMQSYKPQSVLARWEDGAEQTKGTVQHGADGIALVKLPSLKAGAYRLHYETTDAFGQKFTVARELVVAGERAPVALAAALMVEKSGMRVGEVARLLATSGFEGQPLMLDLYQGDKRVLRKALVGGQSPAVVEVPVTEALRGGFTAVLTLVRDWQLVQFSEHVFVPWDNKELSLEFATFRDKIRPGAKETFRVTVKGPKGAKVEAGAAELLAYMYDQSLDLFAPHSPPSVSSLYPPRMSSVSLLSSLSQGASQWLVSNGYGEAYQWVPPSSDRLKFEDNYGLGGPGYRRYRGGHSRSMESFGAVSAARPAPVARSEAKMESRREESEAPPPPPGAPPMEEMASAADKQQAGGLAQAEAAPAALRSNFAETAFWVPQLLTGADGAATLEFTVPDSVTAWSVWVHGLTRDLEGGAVQRTTRSVKELMVRPYVPRFLREGDRAVLEVVVNNASEQARQGTLTLDIIDPETKKSLLSEFGVKGASQNFTVAPGKGTNLRFPLTTPARVGTVAFRVEARAGNLSDGELRPLPVLPGRVHLAQSRFVTLKGPGSKTMRFDDLKKGGDATRVNEQLVVTVDTQLFYAALQSLPYLVNYPYECSEQTLNRFVSSGILASLYGKYPAVAKMAKEMSQRPTRFETWDSVDPNRKMTLEETPWLEMAKGGADSDQDLVKVLDPKVARAERDSAMGKLRKAQTSSGGFPWWPGGPPSPYMTLYIVHGLSRAMEYGVEVPQDMTRNAWGYLARHFREEYAEKLSKKGQSWEFITFLNYVASAYPDASYTGDALTADERKAMLAFSFTHWKKHSPYLKGYLALTLKRSGRPTDALKVWDSVMDSAKTTEELGTYWAPEDRSWLWYNDTTETQAFALRVLTELKPKDERREGLVQWLLLDKKLNHWKSTRATAEALYALVKYLEAEGALGIREDAKVTVGPRVVQMEFAPDVYTGKKNQVVVPGPELRPETMSTVVVEKTTKGFAFASATWHFSTEMLPDEDRGDFFQVSRRYFRREREGREAVLQPLAEGAVLNPGDEVEVQISLRTKHAAEYVHLRDPRAAGLEPENAQSRHKYDLGIVWYEETRDSGTNFFFEWLPAGEYTFKYRVRANMAGTFRVGPATVQSMYAPEFTAYSAGAVLTVGPAK